MAKPWYVVDLMTGESLGRFETEVDAVTDTKVMMCSTAVIQYRPRKSRVKSKFPSGNPTKVN